MNGSHAGLVDRMAKRSQIPSSARWAPLSLIVALCATSYPPRVAVAPDDLPAHLLRRSRCACVKACVGPESEESGKHLFGLSVALADGRMLNRSERAVAPSAIYPYPTWLIVHRAPKRGPPAVTL